MSEYGAAIVGAGGGGERVEVADDTAVRRRGSMVLMPGIGGMIRRRAARLHHLMMMTAAGRCLGHGCSRRLDAQRLADRGDGWSTAEQRDQQDAGETLLHVTHVPSIAR